MKRLGLHARFIAAFLAVAAVGSYAIAGDGSPSIEADRLIGYEENPDVSTVAGGTFEAKIDRPAETIRFGSATRDSRERSSRRTSTSGKPAVNGGISAFLCSNLTDPAPRPERSRAPSRAR